MKYLVLVSHGEFAAGLKTSLMMLAGQRDDVIASGLPDGKTADEFAEIFKESVKDIHEDDEIVLLADIVGGSPLTTALNEYAGSSWSETTLKSKAWENNLIKADITIKSNGAVTVVYTPADVQNKVKED